MIPKSLPPHFGLIYAKTITHSNSGCEVHPTGPRDKSKWESSLSLSLLGLGTSGDLQGRSAWHRVCVTCIRHGWGFRNASGTHEAHPSQDEPDPHFTGTLLSLWRPLTETLGLQTLVEQRPLKLTCGFLLLQSKLGASQESVVLFLRLLIPNFLVIIIV